MRKRILIFVCIISLLSSCHIFKKDNKDNDTDLKSSDKEASTNTIIKKDSYLICFYNVENLFDTINNPNTDDDEFTPSGSKKWDFDRYEKKLNDISWVLSSIDKDLPAIVGLCEVENYTVVSELSKKPLLKSGKYRIVHEESPDSRGIDVALMYREDLFKYYSHRSVPVTIPDAPQVKLRDILYVKGSFAESDTFHIFINHWKSRRGGKDETEYKRMATAKILKSEIDKIFLQCKHANIIIMGDFNDEPQNCSLNEVLNATNNSENKKFDELYNLMYKNSEKGEGSISRNYKWYMLDNLIVSASVSDGVDFFVESDKGYIFKPQKILYYNAKADFYVPNKTYGGKNYYGGYSDHLPVYFILKR